MAVPSDVKTSVPSDVGASLASETKPSIADMVAGDAKAMANMVTSQGASETSNVGRPLGALASTIQAAVHVSEAVAKQGSGCDLDGAGSSQDPPVSRQASGQALRWAEVRWLRPGGEEDEEREEGGEVRRE